MAGGVDGSMSHKTGGALSLLSVDRGRVQPVARATQRDARPPFQKRQGTGLWWEGGGGPEDVKARI